MPIMPPAVAAGQSMGDDLAALLGGGGAATAEPAAAAVAAAASETAARPAAAPAPPPPPAMGGGGARLGIGEVVTINGLQAKPELNGSTSTVLGWDGSKGRCALTRQRELARAPHSQAPHSRT